MANKIKKMMNNGTAYTVGGVESSNDTYENIIHLSQAEYDALENPDPDTMYSTPDSESPGVFNPENEGETGQVLTKTETGYAYCDLPKERYIDLIVVGGGGGTYNSSDYGGGGGGGVVECINYKLSGGSGDSFYVSVGEGGSSGQAGHDSYICSCSGSATHGTFIIGYGGGYGGGSRSNGGNGGNGGGGGYSDSYGCLTRGGIGCNGFPGGIGSGCGAGGGGGAGSIGFTPFCYGEGIGIGGQGYISRIFRSGYLFGTGGNGGQKHGTTIGGGFPKFCGGGGDAANNACCGCKGIVIIRYLTDGSNGISCATGGTVETSGEYTYHTFTSSGTFCIES